MKLLLLFTLLTTLPIAATKKPAAGLDEGKEKEVPPMLKLVSQEGAETTIDRQLAIRSSNMIRTSLENDETAEEIGLPSIPLKTLKPIITAITMAADPKFQQEVTKSLTTKKLADRPRTRRTEEVINLSKTFLAKPQEELPELIYAANYLDTPLVLDALIEAYTQTADFTAQASKLLKEQATKKPGALRGELRELIKALSDSSKLPLTKKIPAALLSAIARSYFLQTGNDIDELLGLNRVHIPFEDIAGRGLIPDHYFKNFPDLERDINSLSYFADTGTDQTALSAAVVNDDLETVRVLLRIKGINPNFPAYTPLIQAIFNRGSNTAEMVAELLRAGADPNLIASGPTKLGVPGSAYGTALHAAADKHNLVITRLLLAAGAKPDIKTPSDEWTPLMFAAHRHGWEVVLELLKAGANADLLVGVPYQRIARNTAGHASTLQLFKNVIEYLKENGKAGVAEQLEKKIFRQKIL